ncbi:Alpha/Beta hydrolase protein [Roridomyces roridus]|uniref:acylaminoacyl-peptidase n=1 Tax=Roridomyces roridus TaxID=1738132 RepID=A0AAD7B046_9AGAR|nr:Alpha/Beta hydrolase protein [Roridomyces roridus]
MSLFRSLSEIPVPTAAQFIDKDAIQLETTVRDNTRDIKRSLSSTIFLNSPSPSREQLPTTPAVDTGDVVASLSAELDGKCFPRRAVLRETLEKKRFVEIWVGGTLEVSQDVTDSHEGFYSDEIISTLAFSPTEFAFMYVAEGNETRSEGEKFTFSPDLGEGVGGAGKKRPTIFIFRWDPEAIPCTSSLASVDPGKNDTDGPVLFGQAVFSPLDSATIYATGYELTADGRLLGSRWCANRPSGIWQLTLPTPQSDSSSLVCISSRKLTPYNLSCRSPRIYHDKDKATLFYLAHHSGGPHAGTYALHSLDISTSSSSAVLESRVLVDTVWEPHPDTGFPGLYPEAGLLPSSPFVRIDGKVWVVFASMWGSRTTVVAVSGVDCERVVDLTPVVQASEEEVYSYGVLGTDGKDRVILARSAPGVPGEVAVGQVQSDDSGGLSMNEWRVVYIPYVAPAVRTALSTLQCSIIQIPGRGRTETIVVKPGRSDKGTTSPCVQFIHGGPHGASTTAFNAFVAFLAIEGYTVSMPNYTGSIGFGETSVRALLGQCGTVDVQDCIETARYLVKLGVSAEGKGRQFVVGGSHGGFLSAHLIGQFPDFFTAAVIRNPVISASPMSSDIPDWYFNEFGVEYPIYSSPAAGHGRTEYPSPPRFTPELYTRLYPTSPMAYVDAVRAHVLLNIGGSDRRVTPTHGVEYYHALKGNATSRTRARSVESGHEEEEQDIEMHWFEKEGHSLDGVQVARVVAEMAVRWFTKYRA